MKEAELVKQKSVTHPGPLRYQVIHCVFCDGNTDGHVGRVMYLEQPWTVHAGRHRAHLRGSQEVSNMELYLERNKDVGFIVFQDYVCCGEPNTVNRNRLGRGVDTRLMSMMVAEHIDIVSDDLRSTLADLSDVAFEGVPHPKFGRTEDEEEDAGSEYVIDDESSGYDIGESLDVSYPYLWFYHRRHKLSDVIDCLEDSDKGHVNVFCGYIQDRMADEWAAVDKLISKGEISAEYIRYIYVSLLTKLVDRVANSHRFQERLLSRRQKAPREPSYRRLWLQTGSMSTFHGAPINSRPL